MIYLWEIPEKYKNRDIGKYDEDHSPERFLLKKGERLNEFLHPTVHFKIPQKKILQFDCLPNTSMVPLVNYKIRRILEKIAPKDIQFFPAKLLCADGELEGYSFLNITHLVKGIDHEQSICVKMDDFNGSEFINRFHSLTYLKECMKEHLLARDEEYHGNLLVSDQINRIFQEEKITGVWLVRPEEFYRPFTSDDLINDSLGD